MEKVKFAALLSLEDSNFISSLSWRNESLKAKKQKIVNLSEIASSPWNGSSRDVADGTRRALREWVLGQMFSGSFTIVLSFPGPEF